MEKIDDSIYIPINLILSVLLSTMIWGINALILFGITAAPLALFIILCIYLEAAFNITPIDSTYAFVKKIFIRTRNVDIPYSTSKISTN